MFDQTTFYVAARCWDSAPPSSGSPTSCGATRPSCARTTSSASSSTPSTIAATASSFYTNPLGALSDIAVTDEGNPNPDWNPVWDVRTGRFDGGWTVEMAIPFKSLRYHVGTEPDVGHPAAARRSAARTSGRYLTPLPQSMGGPQGALPRLGGGTLVGLDLPPASRNLELKPYAHLARSRPIACAAPPISNDLDGDVGVDVKYGITANLTADLTFNTDFAQVEVDEQQVNLTRFSLFFPEKRDFFLEGRGIFDFGRGGVTGGGRGSAGIGATRPTSADAVLQPPHRAQRAAASCRSTSAGASPARSGKFGVGVMNIQTGDEVGRRPRRRPTSRSCASSATSCAQQRSARCSPTGRRRRGRPGSNQAYGVDAAFSFFQNLTLGGYYARTQTDGPATGDDDSYQGRFDYGGDRYGAQVEYLKVGDNFNPEVGFVRRDDFERSFGVAALQPAAEVACAACASSPARRRSSTSRTAPARSRRAQQIGRFNVEFENSDQFTSRPRDDYELLVAPFAMVARRDHSRRAATTSATSPRATRSAQQRRVVGHARGAGWAVLRRHDSAPELHRGARVACTKQLLGRAERVDQSRRAAGRATSRPRCCARAPTTRSRRGCSPARCVQYSSSRHERSAATSASAGSISPGSEFFVVYTDERDTLTAGFPTLKNRAFVVKINRLWRL